MLVNEEIITELYENAGDARYSKALNYAKEKRVTITNVEYENKNNFALSADVKGNKNTYNVFIKVEDGEIKDIKCSCLDNAQNYCTCKHILATMIEFIDNAVYEKLCKNQVVQQKNQSDNKMDHRGFKQLIKAFYNTEVDTSEEKEKTVKDNKNVKIIPSIIFDSYYKEIKVEFKLGTDKFYKIKSLSDFYTSMLNKESVKYGNKLEFIHTKENFARDSLPILEFILKHAEIIKYVNSSGNAGYRYYGKVLSDNCIILSNTGLDEFFEIVKGKKLEITQDGETGKISFIPGTPNIKFKLSEVSDGEFELVQKEDIFEYYVLEGKEYIYIVLNDFIYRCNKNYKNTVIKLLDIYKKNFIREIRFNKKELPDFFSLVLPKMKEYIDVSSIDTEKLKDYIPKDLIVKMFLDFDKNNYIIAELKFMYGEIEFNPLDLENIPKVARNVIQESNCLNMCRKTGFLLDSANKRFVLVSDDAIYNFLSQDINNYTENYEVLVTDNFKTKEIRQPKLGIVGVKIENNLLNIDLTGLDFDRSELKEILEKYNLKKKYHRLKDGSFLDLEQNEDIKFLNSLEYGMEVNYKDLEKGKIRVPVYRSLYLNKLLENVKNVEIQKDKEYKELVNNIDEREYDNEINIPNDLNCTLRYYQKVGYKWLKILDDYKFGGILADDMGLGKTVQLISVLLDYKEHAKVKLPSIVVTPSSLALNWKSEIEKFAKNIKVLVIRGNSEEREKQIKSIPNYDLVITSYDLLKRDMDVYKQENILFKYQIADEAQYIKNSNTQNAKSLKAINAQTRYALTGTPIENSLAELWSIFDYIMPGYLFTYKKFKQLYEIPIMKDNDEEAMQKLKMMIKPFVLRRVKKDVLKELPEKSITVLNNEMQGEQLQIYLSYLAQAKKQAISEIEGNGIEKSQIKILALLTRLRQICCHPSLFLENYMGESSKLSQCIEIVKDAIAGRHKILIFSGYTSMLNIIEGNLAKEGINYYKLTGQTKVDERVKLVNDFNNNPDVKVFLISLKAGGTGLNLIGADMVIHYDPWWNMSAENQATDRAYRIGQKNNVQVYKLITKNSIEEKIYELQEKKSKLIDSMLSTQTTFINKLNKDDIIELFS